MAQGELWVSWVSWTIQAYWLGRVPKIEPLIIRRTFLVQFFGFLMFIRLFQSLKSIVGSNNYPFCSLIRRRSF